MTPFILFFGLTVATAVIAYWSDNLGKKLGKKRVSLWGLRPRTTATVITIASSWGIMIATILVLLIVAEPLRSALFRFDRERAFNAELQKSRAKLEQQNKTQASYLAKLEGNIASAQKQLETANQKVQKANTDVQLAETQAKKATDARKIAEKARTNALRAENRARADEKRARNGERRAKNQAQSAKNQASTAKQSLNSARGQLRLTRSQLAETGVRLVSVEANLTDAESRYTSAQTRLNRAQEQLEKAQQGLAGTREQAKNAYRQATAAFTEAAAALREVAATRQQVEDLKVEREKLQNETEVLRTQYERLYNVAAALDEQFQLATTANVRISVGQNLASGLIDTNQVNLQIEARLKEIFNEGQIEVARQIDQATLSLSPLVLRIDNQMGVGALPSEQVIPTLAGLISNRGLISVRLVADRNFSANEKEVTARFVTVAVRSALDKGVVLAEVPIDGHLSDAKVFSQLLDLVDRARAGAVSKSINPPISPAQPYFAQGTNELLFDALRKIRQINGPTRVRIRSAQPLSTVDSPQIRFEVEEEKN